MGQRQIPSVTKRRHNDFGLYLAYLANLGRKRIRLTLRTNHLTYLEYIADRDRSTVHDAMNKVIDGFSGANDTTAQRPKKACVDVVLKIEMLDILDRLSAQNGLERSDMARRLIDETQARDQTI